MHYIYIYCDSSTEFALHILLKYYILTGGFPSSWAASDLLFQNPDNKATSNALTQTFHKEPFLKGLLFQLGL